MRAGWCRGHRPRRGSIRPPSAGPRRGDPPAGVRGRHRVPRVPAIMASSGTVTRVSLMMTPTQKVVCEHRMRPVHRPERGCNAYARSPGSCPACGAHRAERRESRRTWSQWEKWPRVPGIRPDSSSFPVVLRGAGAVRRGRGTDAEVPVRPGQTVAAWRPAVTKCLSGRSTRSADGPHLGRGGPVPHQGHPPDRPIISRSGSFGELPGQAIERQAVDLAIELLRHRLEPFDQRPGLVDAAAGGELLEVRRQRRRPPWRTPTAARRACGRPRATAARPGPAGLRSPRRSGPGHRPGSPGTARGAPSSSPPQAASRTTGSSRLVRSPASGGAGPGDAVGGDHPVDRREQLRGPDRLREVVVHAGREAALAVFLPRARRQGDDRQMSPGRPLPLPDRPHDLEAVELRHVDVQEQQVEGPFARPGPAPPGRWSPPARRAPAGSAAVPGAAS